MVKQDITLKVAC